MRTNARVQVLTEESMKMTIFWVMRPDNRRNTHLWNVSLL